MLRPSVRRRWFEAGLALIWLLALASCLLHPGALRLGLLSLAGMLVLPPVFALRARPDGAEVRTPLVLVLEKRGRVSLVHGHGVRLRQLAGVVPGTGTLRLEFEDRQRPRCLVLWPDCCSPEAYRTLRGLTR